MPNGIRGKLIHGRTLTWIYGRKKLKPNWIDNQSDWLLYLAGNRSSRLVQILLYAFCFEIPLSICLSVLPFPSPPTHTHVLPGKYPHPLHCHHGDTWPVTSLCCSSVLVSFFNFTLSFSLLCLADYEWIKQFCVNLQSSFDFYIFYIFNVSFCFFGCLWFVYFSTVNFLLI